ncbi:uncharacterized protein CLUP02_10579 [Colletotrichum lupini]|uniref:Uncharacterized protein n=1 Tax=Colletotrichum lupini TaxID=145971 RepID=A0A9Q8SXK9_9PEZI|nr:uncharacterized protein CLUP02_10579 [Colletotrichum lupini]UQC85083.1 hypothetical protein CLUP02_10579 [Colletotrichum lupini]
MFPPGTNGKPSRTENVQTKETKGPATPPTLHLFHGLAAREYLAEKALCCENRRQLEDPQNNSPLIWPAIGRHILLLWSLYLRLSWLRRSRRRDGQTSPFPSDPFFPSSLSSRLFFSSSKREAPQPICTRHYLIGLLSLLCFCRIPIRNNDHRHPTLALPSKTLLLPENITHSTRKSQVSRRLLILPPLSLNTTRQLLPSSSTTSFPLSIDSFQLGWPPLTPLAHFHTTHIVG